MRIALLAIGLFFAASGIVGMVAPRTLAITHSGGRYWRAGWVTIISKEDCVIYGAASLCLGVAFLWAASLRGPDVARADRSIAVAILAVRCGLEERYGRMEDCTIPQIEKTALDLRLSKKFVPYLCAAFLGKAELESLRKTMPEVKWDVVETSIARITDALPYGDLHGAHFHPSWGTQD